MKGWPKQVRVCTCGAIRGDFKGGHVCTYPERMKVIPADLGQELYEELIALRQELDAARSEAAHEAALSTYYTRPLKELTERVADEMYPEGKQGHFHGGGSPATIRYEREVGE